MAIVMVAMLAFGGTYAYFTATAKGKTATFTTGKVEISTGRTTEITSISKQDIVPGAYVFGAENSAEGKDDNYQSIAITNNSTVKIYTFATLTTLVDIAEDDAEEPNYQELVAKVEKTGDNPATETVEGADNKYTVYEKVFVLTAKTSAEEGAEEGDPTWQALNAGADDGIFYFNNTKPGDEEGEIELTSITNFQFKIMFNSNVESDRAEVDDTEDDSKTTIKETHNVGYLDAEGNFHAIEEVQGIELVLNIQFRAIQQEGFKAVADDPDTEDVNEARTAAQVAYAAL